MDGWHVDDGSGGGSSSSTTGSLPRSLLGHAFGSADSSCTNSAAAFKEEDYYLEQQLCQVYMDLDMDHLFSEEFVVRHTQSAEPFPGEQWQQPSSSSSSPRRSLSASSPDNSPLRLNNTSSNPSTTTTIPSAQRATPLPTSARPAYDELREALFPASASEDTAIASAMLAIFSSSSSSSATPAAAAWNERALLQPSRTDVQACRLRSVFRPYGSGPAPAVHESADQKKPCSGQKMIKNSISILRRIGLMRDHGGATKDSLRSINQLHHVMSERKRREKLNGSFHALRMLLPPGSKKDKASVLDKTKDYLKTLKGQILELEKKNQTLEKHLSPLGEDDDDGDDTKEGIVVDDDADDDEDGGGSAGRVCVRVAEAFQDARGVQRVGLKVAVAAGCDLIELALCVLECLKRMSVLCLLSMDAKTCSHSHRLDLFAWINFKFEIKASDWDEVIFKEAVAGAVDVMTVEEIHDNPLVGVGVP
ncbi:putative transcription factor bHLH041 [Iris pallida]|uniref:Transcription factor bHLH041 n=1 Tax=Iris pallida TaxID=29817 RepID=A0AAX6EGR5_IRIPA|nr:putative transcription factor bHLH041 [Iris pallida]